MGRVDGGVPSDEVEARGRVSEALVCSGSDEEGMQPDMEEWRVRRRSMSTVG